MIVKFFKKHGKGNASSCKACVDYLLNKPDDTAQILQGDPRLSQAIADSLDYNNTYTAGCLSFEEPDLPEQSKREIMARFEKAMFAGLEPEQYNISWVQHTDKGRLELNFVIPNVELTTGKRLQPYYDKADRPLAENFKQVINHEYNLSDPNDPKKQQILIAREDLPSDKKQALQAITDGLTALANAGQINDRQDVINALERAGFEIARITPKNLSIKTDGQNLRLKGAFYEQDFRFGDHLSANIEERAREYKRDSAERYQTARAKLDRAVTARRDEFSRKYPSRAGEIDKKHRENVPLAHNHSIDGSRLDNYHRRLSNVESQERLSRDDRLAIFSGNSQGTLKGDQVIDLSDESRDKAVRSTGSGLHTIDLGRQSENLRDTRTEKGEKINGDRNRDPFRKHIENLARTARERANRFIERIAELAGRKRLDTATVQRNQRTISDLNQLNQSIKQVIEQKQQQKAIYRRPNRGMSL